MPVPEPAGKSHRDFKTASLRLCERKKHSCVDFVELSFASVVAIQQNRSLRLAQGPQTPLLITFYQF